MKRVLAGLVAILTSSIWVPAAEAVPPPSPQLSAISSLLVLTRSEKVTEGINQASLADSLLQTLQKAHDFAVKGDDTNTSAQLTKFQTSVAAQRGTHIFATVADRLLGLADGSIAPDTVTVTPGVATTVTQVVGDVPTSVSIPAGTKIGIVALQPQAVPGQVTSPTTRLPLGGAVVRAYDKYGVPITVPSSALTLKFTVPGSSVALGTNAEVDTLDPKTQNTQRLSSQVVSANDGAVTVTANTPHLSPFTVTAPSTSGVISNFAGSAGEGQATDLGQYEADVAVYHSIIYVSDYDLGVVRAIDATTGRETIAAGTTGSGLANSAAGDGGPASAAFLNYPQGLAVNAGGDLFIADTNNSRIRKVDAVTGTITTVAGTGDATHHGYSGDNGPATSAALFDPDGVAVDGHGDLFISDTGNNAVRLVDGASGTITTLAELGGSPTGITADTDGTLYVAERIGYSETDIVRRTPDGAVSTLLSMPGYDYYTGLALDGAGHLLVSSYAQNTVVSLSLAGCAAMCAAAPFAGTGQDGFAGDGHAATTARLSSPMGIAVDGDGAAYIADSGNIRVRRVDYAGIITTFAGDGTSLQSGDGGVANDAQFSSPEWVTVDKSGNTYVTDYGNNSIRKVDPAGVITTFASKLADTAGIATDSAGNVYVSEIFDDPSVPSKILKIKPDGSISTLISGLPSPGGLAVDSSGNLLVADDTGLLYRVIPNGTSTVIAGAGTKPGTSADNGPASDAQFGQLTDVALDPAGDIYVSDFGQHLVREIFPNGTITTVAGNGVAGSSGDGGPATQAEINFPFGLAIGPAGQLFIADQQEAVVRVVQNGNISTFAGTGIEGHSGDGGPADQSQLVDPQGLATDSAGNVYIVDSAAGCVRVVRQ